MKNGPDIAATARAFADPARAAMLDLMMDGRAYTAGELAAAAGVSPQTASEHLALLTSEGLVAVEKQGRHRYHRIVSMDVVAALEGLLVLSAARGRRRIRPGPRDAAMREARICYDHLAGKWGTRMFSSLIETGALAADKLAVLRPTEAGHARFRAIGVDTHQGTGKRPMCRACFDWSERKSHLGGWLGSQLLMVFLNKGWLRRETGSRALLVTPKGRLELARFMGMEGCNVEVSADPPA
jgi:DNA-binding transcriptional ArsR family regulator